MIICHYCNKETNDEEFCDNCGRFLESIDKNQVDNELEKKIYQYDRCTLDCIALQSDLCEENITQFNSDYIQNPLNIYKNDGRIYFLDRGEVSLEEYLDSNNISFENIYTIIKSLSNIFIHIENEGYILGSLNLSDLWLKNNDISQIFYRQSRRVLVENDNLEGYSKGEISAPEVSNKNSESINRKTDVYIIGRLFMNLVINKRNYLQDYEHERYVGYNLSLFNPDIPKELHNWIGKSTSIYPEERYESVEKCIQEFIYLCELNKRRKEDCHRNIVINYNCITDVGKSKVDISKVNDLSKVNEDSYIVLKNEDKVFAMVADGVSNCSYGSGYDASNITKNVCIKMWQENIHKIENKESVEQLIKNIIRESNKEILEAVKDELEDKKISSRGIMATTFSVAIIINNTLYYTSLGDTPIYLINNENIMLLNIDDNYGNESLRNGINWSDYKDIEEKSSLVKFIGGNFVLEYEEKEIDFKLEELNLIEGDLVLICSDGLTDYIDNISSRGDVWSKDSKIMAVFSKEDASLENINTNLVNIANENGGGDNITIVLIKAETK